MEIKLPAEGEKIGSERDATDLIGNCWGLELNYISVPISRLVPEFFDLSNGLAGAFIQKFVQYNLVIAFVGDLSAEMALSEPLRDFVFECGKDNKVLFVTDESDLPD